MRQRRAWPPDRDRVDDRSLCAQTYVAEVDLLSGARREVLGLATETGEMAQFCMLDGIQYMVILNELGRRTFRITSEAGSGCRSPGAPPAACWSRI